MDDGTRLNKFLASCGVGSRRACDAMVQDGRVQINGQPCLNPAHRVAPEDHVKVDGKRVAIKRQETIAMHKPRGLVCSRDDELGRDTIYSLLPGSLHHLHHVGRLDRDSEGLLILTTDGTLSQSLLHPSKRIEKEYLVNTSRAVSDEHLRQLLRGIFTDDGRLVADQAERISTRRLRLVLTSGHKRQIRVMLETLGYRVERLQRTRIGALRLGALPPGRHQPLAAEEIRLLLENPPPPKPRARAPWAAHANPPRAGAVVDASFESPRSTGTR